MSGIASRWPVAQTHSVEAGDVDDAGSVRLQVLERWIADACAAYLDQCVLLHETESRSGLTVRSRMNGLPDAARLGRPESVIVSAGATEVRPASFTVAVRMRSMGDDGAGGVLNVACEISLEDQAGDAHELGDDIRDELIALAHGARHFN